MPASLATGQCVIPTYHRAGLVGQAVDSVLQQARQDFEVIVDDDGSTDATREALKPYADRIQYLYQPNRGRSAVRHAGIRAAQGKHIAFLDSDDLWLAHKLEKQLSILDSNPRASLVHSLAEVIDDRGRRLPKRDCRETRALPKRAEAWLHIRSH